MIRMIEKHDWNTHYEMITPRDIKIYNEAINNTPYTTFIDLVMISQGERQLF